MALTFQLIVLLGLSSGLWMAAEASSSHGAGCPEGCCMVCPGGWTHNKSRCFQFVNETKNWSDAEGACIARGGNLAAVQYDSDMELLRGMAKLGNKLQRVWTGGYEIKEKKWKWTIGIDFNFNGWGYQEPNNQKEPEDCIEIQIVNEHNEKQPFNDAPCHVKKHFICVRDMILA